MYFKYMILLCLFCYFQIIQINSMEQMTSQQKLKGEPSTEEKILDTPQSEPKTVVVQKQKPLMIRLLALSEAVARKAGEIIRDITLTGALKIVNKEGEGPQTAADRSAQSCILASFKKQFPNINVVAEEPDQESMNLNVPKEWLVTELDSPILELECPQQLMDVKEDQVTIWVDPLDGTFEYTLGHKEYVTVLIGICVGDEAVAGVIYQPYYEEGRVLWGLVGYGVGGFELNQPPKINKDKPAYVTTRSNSSKQLTDILNRLQPCNIIEVGGVGNKVIHVLEGIVDAYVHPTSISNRWDTAAPEAVLRAAGGKLTDRYGKNYRYSYENKNDPKNLYGIIATGPNTNHSEFIERIKFISTQEMTSQEKHEDEPSAKDKILDVV